MDTRPLPLFDKAEQVHKHTDHDLIPLRLFIGITMIAFGVFFLLADPWTNTSIIFIDHHGWLWSAFMTFGGIWLAVSAACEIAASAGFPRRICNYCLIVAGKLRASGYFFCGSIWLGIGCVVMFDTRFQLLDLLSPVYMMALFYFAVCEALHLRKQALSMYDPSEQA